jgi:glycine/D-amino acid oxidase-like deaminating enzyme
MNEPIYDKIIIGAGVAGLAAAYEILSAAQNQEKSLKLMVLTDKINAPTLAGTNIVLGIDGFEEGELPPHASEISDLVRLGLERLNQIVLEENIDCRHDLYFQLIASTAAENMETAAFLIDRFRYKPEEFRGVANPADRLHFDGLGEALETSVIGQLNGPEFLQGLAGAIRRMGGEIIEATLYTGHTKNDAVTEVETTNGIYKTSSPPLLAGGPHLMSKIAGMPARVFPCYTMAMHVELTPEDAKNVCRRPIVFFNLNMDFLWGSLDGKNVLTVGQGATEDPADRPKFESLLRQTFNTVLPNLKGIYDDRMKFSFNAMAYTDNMLPLVGRLIDFDVITGNCGRGFAQSFAQAQAYAEHYIDGNDHNLMLFESLNIKMGGSGISTAKNDKI